MTFHKFPDIERLGSDENREILLHDEDTLIIEEKVDGGNGCFWMEEDGQIHFGSRNRDLTAENDVKFFTGHQEWLREKLKGKTISPDYIFYIEWMAKHTINYTRVPMVIGLDIRLKRVQNAEGAGFFLSREMKELEFAKVGLQTVPLVWRGTVKELKKINIQDLIPKSQYYDGKAEGIVIKNLSRKHPHGNYQLYAKVVTDEFKENNKAVFGSVRQKESDSLKIVETFATDARIRKAVFHFVNENGLPLDRTLMRFVPHYVIKDIFKEEILFIIETYKFIDLKDIKQMIPKRCLSIIDEMMTEKALNPHG